MVTEEVVDAITDGLGAIARSIISLGPGTEYADSDLGALEEIRIMFEEEISGVSRALMDVSTSLDKIASAISDLVPPK